MPVKAAVAGGWKADSSVSRSVMVRVAVAVVLVGSSLVTVPVVVPVMVGRSLAPWMVAVKGQEPPPVKGMVKVSSWAWPAVRAWVSERSLSRV